jgi:hypothetical protein
MTDRFLRGAGVLWAAIAGQRHLPRMTRVLIVEDEPALGDMLRDALTDEGLATRPGTSSAAEAGQCCGRTGPADSWVITAGSRQRTSSVAAVAPRYSSAAGSV